MTKQPWSVQIDDSVVVARHMLAERRIHHLPVVDGGKLVGMVTEPDLMKPPDGEITTVERVMTFAEQVDANIAFSDALELMSERECDALVVTQDGSIKGIFTAMDAVRVLRERIRPHQRRAEPASRARHARTR